MNKIKIVLAALVLLLIPTVCHAAVIDDPQVDSVNSIVTISGTLEDAALYDDILITVLRPNMNHDDLTAFTKSEINRVYAGFAQFVLKDETGKYEVKFKFDAPGDYIITVSSPSLSEPVTYTYFFATLNDKINVVDNMVKSADGEALIAALDLEKNTSIPLKVLGVKYEAVADVSASGLSKVLLALNKEANLTKEDVDLAVSNIAEAVMIEKLNEGKIAEIKADDTEIGVNEIFVDALKVEKIYSDIFKTKLTKDEMKNFHKYFEGKSLTDFKSVNSFFAENVILSMLNYKESWSNLLFPAENCAEFIGITNDILTKYNAVKNKGSVADKLNVTFKSIADYKNKFTTAVNSVYISENQAAPRPSGGGGGGGGGGGSTPAIVQPPVSEPAPEVTDKTEEPEGTKNFTDIDESHWAYSYVNELKDKNIISGYADGSFKPNQSVKREEFIKLVVEALELSKEGDAEFSDVPDDSWFAPYVKAAVNAGIINGVSENTFGAGNELTRADMAVIISRALKLSGEANEELFTDNSEIPEYAQNAVYMLKAEGIISGNNGNYEPKRSLTRAECAKIINLIIK